MYEGIIENELSTYRKMHYNKTKMQSVIISGLHFKLSPGFNFKNHYQVFR